ncbi:MAG: DMT family transporter [Burkholderiales bacterium]|nr:DMT family transporter [Burkholderiales bacterium]
MTLQRRELGLFIAVVLLWGVNWPLMKMALAELDFWVFRSYCVIAGLCWFVGYCVSRGVSLKLPREYWLRMGFCALCNVAAWNILSAAALRALPSGRAGVLAYTMPLWVVLLSRFFLGEALTATRVAALSIGMGGIGLLLIDEMNALRGAPVAALMMVASGLLWAVGIVLFKGFPKSLPTATLMVWSLVLGGWPLLAGLAMFGHGPWLPSGAAAWTGLLFNVTVVFGFCWFAWNELVRALPAQITGISSLAVPIVGFASGMLLLGERPRPFDYLALVAIVAAVALVLKPQKSPLA